MRCPACRTELVEVKLSHGIFWHCDQCGGRALTIELLRRTFSPDSINPLWLHAMENAGQPGRPCPQCEQPMLTVSFPGTGLPPIDICKKCHVVWFDRGEVETLQPRAPQAEPPRLSPEQTLALVNANAQAADEVDRVRRHAAAWGEIGRFFDTPVPGWWGLL
jgi:Zn-finger nucleic acid-binding protein